MKQQPSSYPVNNAYISSNFQSIRKPQITMSYNPNPLIQSQSILTKNPTQSFQTELYSQSSTLINNSSLIQENITNFKKSFKEKSKTLPFQQSQKGEISSQLLHKKILFLENQLQELTKLLNQDNKASNISHSQQYYEELAIQNAQLTIKIQQLQQQKLQLLSTSTNHKQQYSLLAQQYQKQHIINNELRQRILQFQQKFHKLQQNIISSQPNLQSQTQLTQQIQQLLLKLHNLNIEFNQEQEIKQQLMERMNLQNQQIQKLRKEISDFQVNKLQLEQTNTYLNQEIQQVNQIANHKQREIQDRYIKQEIQSKYFYQAVQKQNQTLKKQNQTLKYQNQTLKHENQTIKQHSNYMNDNQTLKYEIQTVKYQNQTVKYQNQTVKYQNQRLKQINISLQNKINNLGLQIKQLQQTIQSHQQRQNSKLNDSIVSQHGLKSQIRILNKQLQQQNQRKQLIKKKYTEMSIQQQNRISQLEQKNHQLILQIRKLNQKINQKNKQIDLKESRYTEELEKQTYSRFRDQTQIKRRIQHQKDQQVRIYANKNYLLQAEIKEKLDQITTLKNNLLIKDKQIQDKSYLIIELQQLQQRHNQLIDEVNNIKRSKSTEQQQFSTQKQRIQHELEQQIVQLKQTINKLKQQLRSQVEKRNSLQFEQQKPFLPNATSCVTCPQILKQFSIYKQLMQLKFQTMNQVFDELKISFTNNQLKLRENINLDKGKYDMFIYQYDQHDKQYKVLMERLWEWEKINVRSQHARNLNKNQHNNNSYLRNQHKKTSNARQIINHPYQSSSYQSKKSSIYHQNTPFVQKQSKQLTYKQRIQKSQQKKPLSDIEYDLYLIKLQNSTLRSQICILEKQMSQKKQKNPQMQRQLQQLKKYSDNLLYQNEQLKSHLTQIVTQKQIKSSKQISLNPSIQQSYYQKYSSILPKSPSIIQSQSNQQLLIKKLQKQNDNQIQLRHQLECQYDQLVEKYQKLLKLFQKQQTRREHYQAHSPYQVLDRNNIPIEFIRYHPEHKKLQQQYISLKRAYLQLDLQFKKYKTQQEEKIQKLLIQNKFHQQRITQLQNQPKNQTNQNFFSFSQKFNLKSSANTFDKQSLQLAQNKIRNYQQRVLYLQNQVNKKILQCENYSKKYELLMKQVSNQQNTQQTRQTQNITISKQKIQSNSRQTRYSSNGLNKQKIQSNQRSIPRLNLNMDQNNNSNQQSYETKYNFNDIINQTLQLKNQRRSGLKKFQKQVQRLIVN